jgi:CBS domain-containing protein
MGLARNLKHETVSALSPTPPWHVHPTQTVAETVKVMRDRKVGCVLVCVERRVVGIFTERDLVRRVLAPGRPLTDRIGDHMTADPVTVHPRDPIGMAIKRMFRGGYRHLPVVVDGRPTGILSVKRVVHYLVEHFPVAVYNQPPEHRALPQKREGA